MTNLSTIENKISNTQKHIKIAGRYRKYSREKIEKDVDVRGMVERYLYLSAQGAIDLAEAVISFKNFRKPTTMSEAFYILEEEAVIKDKLAEKMVEMVGFRNIISYGYEKVDYDIVYDVLHNGLKEIEKFLKIISKF